MGMEKKTPTPTGIGMAKQLNSVSDTKGEESKEENSSLVRDKDQNTKPGALWRTKLAQRSRGCCRENLGHSALELACMGTFSLKVFSVHILDLICN